MVKHSKSVWPMGYNGYICKASREDQLKFQPKSCPILGMRCYKMSFLHRTKMLLHLVHDCRKGRNHRWFHCFQDEDGMNWLKRLCDYQARFWWFCFVCFYRGCGICGLFLQICCDPFAHFEVLPWEHMPITKLNLRWIWRNFACCR